MANPAAASSNEPRQTTLSGAALDDDNGHEHPVFPLGKQTTVEFVANSDQKKTVSVDVARPKGKKLQFIEPTLVEAKRLGEDLGYLKIAMFPGMIGVLVANQISGAVASLS
jgi:carboxyl-terminal processing protease